MPVLISEDTPSSLATYELVPSTLIVRDVLDVLTSADGLDGLRLARRKLDAPYTKNYDADPASRPASWPERFDVTKWGFLTAWFDNQPVGKAAIAWDTPGADISEQRSDVAVLWDIRVADSARRKGIGTALFRAAEQWSARRRAQFLMAETQNVNVPACRFYAAQHCVLGAIHRFAYPTLPDESRLLWFKELSH